MLSNLFFLLLAIPLLLINAQSSPQPGNQRAGSRLRVATLNNSFQPFASVKAACVGVALNADNDDCRGNNRFEGFCLDLLNAVKEEMGNRVDFEFVSRQEPGLGMRRPDGSVDGLIGLAQRKGVDLVCAPMAVNEERPRLMEFSQPIMNSGISIMMRRPGSSDWCISSFFQPFTRWMWFTIFLTFLLLLLARLLLGLLKKRLRNPPANTKHQQLATEDTTHAHPQHNDNLAHNQNTDQVHIQHYEYRDHYGIHEHPNYEKIKLIQNIRRLLKYILIGLTIALTVFYLAGLINHLIARQRQRQQINGLNDLIARDNMRYGMVRNGDVHQFFEASNDPQHQQLLRNVEAQSPSGFVANYSEGLERVRDSDGNYALILESTANDYANREDCSTYQAGPNIHSFNYALGMPTGSPWRSQINSALSSIQADGRMREIQDKWWNANGECPSEIDSHRLGWSDGLCFLFILLPLILLLGLLYTFLKHMMARKNRGKRVEVNRRQGPTTVVTEQQRRLQPGFHAGKNDADNGHQNVNFEGRSHHGAQPGVVIDHPIRVEDKHSFNGRRA